MPGLAERITEREAAGEDLGEVAVEAGAGLGPPGVGNRQAFVVPVPEQAAGAPGEHAAQLRADGPPDAADRSRQVEGMVEPGGEVVLPGPGQVAAREIFLLEPVVGEGEDHPVSQGELGIGRDGRGEGPGQDGSALDAGRGGRPLGGPEGSPQREEGQRAAPEAPRESDGTPGPLPLLGLGGQEGAAHQLESAGTGAGVPHREREAQGEIGPRVEAGGVHLRRTDGRVAALGEERPQPAQAQLIAQVRIERGEVEGRVPGGPVADVERPEPARGAADPAGISEGAGEQPAHLDSGAELVGAHVVERLGQDEGTGGISIFPDRLPAGETPREDEAALSEESGPEPGGDPGGHRHRGAELPVAFDAHIHPQQASPGLARQPAERGGVGITAQVPGAGQVARQVQHAERLPAHSGGVPPDVLEIGDRREQRIGGAPHRHLVGDQIRLIAGDPAGQPDAAGREIHERAAEAVAGVAPPDKAGELVDHPAQVDPEPAAPRLELIGGGEGVRVAGRPGELGNVAAVVEARVEPERIDQPADQPAPAPLRPADADIVAEGPVHRFPEAPQIAAVHVGPADQLRIDIGAGIGDLHRHEDPERGGEEAVQSHTGG